MTDNEIIVSIALGDEDITVGKLWAHNRSGKESASFAYDERWLNHPKKFALEPNLPLTNKTFYTRDKMFGFARSSAPDRWGRILMRRAASSKAKESNTTQKTIFEADYVLGVSDAARQGALRLSKPDNPSNFLAINNKNAIPPLIQLPKLISATERLLEDEETYEDLQLLLAPGSSLGGARPKASVLDQEGLLSIAKFSNKYDEYDVVAWESVALDLAKNAGINVPSWKLENILDQNVLIIKRFDRTGEKRIPFLSAMSMLGAKDNQQHSYLEIAYALLQYGSSPNEDLQELWRRIVFNIMIANTDDHLRNHGFLYNEGGWRLSPAYDMNPTPIEIKPRILTTAIDFENNNADIETAKAVAKEFRLSESKANTIIKEVAISVQNWRKTATYYGISKRECGLMSSAFNIASF